MSLLPAVVPAIPEARGEIVPARLARKIGPLFGVPWPDGPFGCRTWVGDYSRITLTEIARGAPLPTRTQAAAAREPKGDWEMAGRIALAARGASLPNEIANATLNRFGPDTKAAVVLTGANRLLDPVHDAVVAAVELLVDHDHQPLPARQRLVGWASMVVEAFRSQPALVAAAVRARTIQRQLCISWELPHPGIHDEALTRCEISAQPVGRAPSQPVTLDIVDRTLAALVRPRPGAPDSEAQLVDPTADTLCDSLLAVGTLRDASHLWLAEREPGEIVVEALVPPTAMIARTVDRALGAAGLSPRDDELPVVPAVPDVGTFAALTVLGRRATLIGLLGVLRALQAEPMTRERTRRDVLLALDSVRALLPHLPSDDPAAAVAACRIALMRVQTRRHDASADIGDDVDTLSASSDRCAELAGDGALDRGAAAEILAAAAIELNAVRWTNAALPGSTLPAPARLDERLRRTWARYLALLGAPEPGASDEQLPGLLGYHLHNYAAFLASHTDSEQDLRAAVDLYRTAVIPAREEFRARTGDADPSRHAFQVGCRATTALAVLADAAGDTEPARRWARLGREWIGRALACDGVDALLAAATERSCRLALHAVPALLTAVEHGVGLPDDTRTAARLLDVAVRWEASAVGDGDRHTRHGEIEDLRRRLAALDRQLTPAAKC